MIGKISNSLCLSGFFTIVILWQMLLPGYILTLDMVFTPKVSTSFGDGSFYNSLPHKYLFNLLNVFLDGWIIQKIMLLALFICLFYLALKYLPVPNKYHADYWAALFYVINPFVYERFLAGHWQLLIAYAFLPPLIFYLFKFTKEPNWRNSAWLWGWLFLIGVFSLHFLVMAILILICYLIFQLIRSLINKKRELTRNIFKFAIISGFIFLILSSYWLVPYLLNRDQSIINDFSQENIEAFKTSGDARLGTSLHVLALYGYWNESQPWANYWLWPKDNFIFWSIMAAALFIIIALGIFFGLNLKEFRAKTIFFLILSLLAFIFSCGIGDTIFKPINQWLIDNVFFWRGFRDSNKFSAFLVLSYAYFGSLGFYYLIIRLRKFKMSKFALIALFALPLLYTYPMLGGFARQLQPVWYPDSWNQANEIIKQDQNDYKILFLPWHGYLSFDFNHKLILANPASSYFGKKIIQSQNMELDPKGNNLKAVSYQQVENLIINENQLGEKEILNILQSENIKYIIRAKELGGLDIYNYNFLKANYLWTIFDMPEITLYQVQKN